MWIPPKWCSAQDVDMYFQTTMRRNKIKDDVLEQFDRPVCDFPDVATNYISNRHCHLLFNKCFEV